MANIFYAKININSKIFDVYNKKDSIENIMEHLYKRIDDNIEYTKKFFYTQETKEGILTKESSEIYCFSNILKTNKAHKKYITGSVVRRFPMFAEEYDKETRQSKDVVHKNNSTSINFYFDINQEIITFQIRTRFGQIQFIEAFQELANLCLEDVAFEVRLIVNPFSIREQLKKVHRITKITSTIIPPNVNEEALKSLYDRDVKNMEQANITKKTNIFEVSKKSKNGINIDSEMIAEVLYTDAALNSLKRGYSKIAAEGKHKDGSAFSFNSDENAPFITVVDDNVKNNQQEFINESQKGITILLAKLMST